MLGKHSKWLFTLSLAFLVVAIILAAWGFPKIVGNQIQKNVQIENSSMMFDKWVKLPMPLTFKVYLFNVTNVDEINEGEKPRLQEIGPYIYKQYRERTHLKYGPNDTVKYMLKKTFIYDSEASGDLTEDDQLTVINFSYLGAIHQVNDMMPMAVSIVNGALVEFFGNLTDPFYTVSVKDLLFDGIFLNCIGNNSALALVCGQIRANTPATMRPAENGTGFYFSMFSHMNLSESGPYVIKRGTENIKELGSIVSYKGDTSMSQWGDKYCGQINGTDATIYPPIDEDNVPSRLYNFEPEICRSLYASLVDKRTFFNISTYYYEISESALAAHSANHDNKCFCKKNWSGNHDGCLIMGLLNLQPCQGAPALASLPHFYLGSDELLEYFDEGISPDKEKHNTYVYIDPVTGVILKGAKRMQFNIELRRFENIPQLRQVPTGLFPLLWIEEGAEIPDYLKTEILNSHNLLSYVEAARWILLGIAIICVIVCAAAVARSASLFSWPHNSNSVSFILNASPKNGNKGM